METRKFGNTWAVRLDPGEEVTYSLKKLYQDEENQVYGGHLNEAAVSATAEIFIDIPEGSIGRRFDENIGLKLREF